MQSGSRIDVITAATTRSTDSATSASTKCSDDVYAHPRTLTQYFNPAAFAQPAPGTYGNLMRNALVGPNFWKVDLAVARQLALVSSQTVELRLEAFNLFNTFNWGVPWHRADRRRVAGKSQFGNIRAHHHAGGRPARRVAHHPTGDQVRVLGLCRVALRAAFAAAAPHRAECLLFDLSIQVPIVAASTLPAVIARTMRSTAPSKPIVIELIARS
jgi:hypothetical protein